MRALGPASGVENRTLLSGPLSLAWTEEEGGGTAGEEDVGLEGLGAGAGAGLRGFWAGRLGRGWERRRV